MPANNSCGLVSWLAAKAPRSMGHIYTPQSGRPPRIWLPYGLDNGAFALNNKKLPLDWEAWEKALNQFCNHAQLPLWIVVPDVIYNGEETLKQWDKLAPSHKSFNIPLALAVQDGMTVQQVKSLELAPDIIFIGGSTDWKWDTMPEWCESFPRVHVARVNGKKGLELCQAAGAESCDGSGWFRGDPVQLMGMAQFIAEVNNLDPVPFEKAVHSLKNSRMIQQTDSEWISLPTIP